MFNLQASPSIDGCVFRQNSATEMGGGMYNEYSSPMVVRSEFRMNASNKGAGMRNYINSNPIITDSTFITASRSVARIFSAGGESLFSSSRCTRFRSSAST